MAVSQALRVKAGASYPQRIPETDQIDISGLARVASGAATLYTDAFTTGVTLGGGTAYTGSTFGKASVTDTFLGSVQINGNLNVNGTATTINTTSITSQDVILTLALTNRTTAGANAAFAVYRGSDAAGDSLLFWNESANRWDFGLGNTGSGGGTLPSAPTAWNDIKINNLTVAGTTITGVGSSLTVTIASNNLTLSTTTSGTLAATSAGALNLSGAAASTWQITSAGLTIQTVTSGTLAITSAGALNLTSSTATSLTATTSISLSSTTSTSITATTTASLTAGASSDLTLGARGQNYTFNDASNVSLNAGFTGVTSIIGALNYLYSNVGAAMAVTLAITNKQGSTITYGQALYFDGTGAKTVKLASAAADNAAADCIGFVQPVGGIANNASGNAVVGGTGYALFQSGDTVPAYGAALYLSTTAGYVTGTAPSANPNDAVHVGFLEDTTGLTGTFGADTALPILVHTRNGKVAL